MCTIVFGVKRYVIFLVFIFGCSVLYNYAAKGQNGGEQDIHTHPPPHFKYLITLFRFLTSERSTLFTSSTSVTAHENLGYNIIFFLATFLHHEQNRKSTIFFFLNLNLSPGSPLGFPILKIFC